MAKNKKELTPAQKQKRYRLVEKMTEYSEYPVVALPYLIMGAVNFDKWFKTTEGWKVGLGGALAIGLMCIVWYSIIKKRDTETSKTGGMVKLLIGFLAVAFILMLLANIIMQIGQIMLFGALGIAGALGLEITSNHFQQLADEYKEELKHQRKEQIRKEVQKDAETNGEDQVDLT